MAPFIRFTEKAGSADEREIFVNAEHVMEVTYIQKLGELQITLLGNAGRVSHALHGQEAVDGLNVLRSLKR